MSDYQDAAREERGKDADTVARGFAGHMEGM